MCLSKSIVFIAFFAVVYAAEPGGKYKPSNDGKYVKSNEGTYKPTKSWKYIHVDDKRHLGKYQHIHIPYDGGYGPYAHLLNPYLHQTDPTPAYSEPTVSKQIDPFKTDVFYIPTPDIYEAYGLPNPSSKQSQLSLPSQPDLSESASIQVLAFQLPPDNFKKPKYHKNHITDSYLRTKSSLHNKLVSVPQTTTTRRTTTRTTTTPRPPPVNSYHNEGGWKIIRQQGAIDRKKYEYFYETENGILAAETAKVDKHDVKDKEGTAVEGGFYQYTGDDGKLYRVDYKAGEHGFEPQGEHIPTSPPVPKEIQRLIDFINSQKNENDNQNSINDDGRYRPNVYNNYAGDINYNRQYNSPNTFEVDDGKYKESYAYRGSFDNENKNSYTQNNGYTQRNYFTQDNDNVQSNIFTNNYQNNAGFTEGFSNRNSEYTDNAAFTANNANTDSSEGSGYNSNESNESTTTNAPYTDYTTTAYTDNFDY